MHIAGFTIQIKRDEVGTYFRATLTLHQHKAKTAPWILIPLADTNKWSLIKKNWSEN